MAVADVQIEAMLVGAKVHQGSPLIVPHRDDRALGVCLHIEAAALLAPAVAHQIVGALCPHRPAPVGHHRGIETPDVGMAPAFGIGTLEEERPSQVPGLEDHLAQLDQLVTAELAALRATEPGLIIESAEALGRERAACQGRQVIRRFEMHPDGHPTEIFGPGPLDFQAGQVTQPAPIQAKSHVGEFERQFSADGGEKGPNFSLALAHRHGGGHTETEHEDGADGDSGPIAVHGDLPGTGLGKCCNSLRSPRRVCFTLLDPGPGGG